MPSPLLSKLPERIPLVNPLPVKEIYMVASTDIQNGVVMWPSEVGQPCDFSQPNSEDYETSQVVTSRNRSNQQRPWVFLTSLFHRDMKSAFFPYLLSDSRNMKTNHSKLIKLLYNYN